jgi:DNA-binding IclR family transcriptional regulator
MYTVRVLERLAFRPLSAPELGHALGVHPRTARRLLVRLHEEDYATVAAGSRRRYRLTGRLAALGRQAIAHDEALTRAAPWIAKLANRTGQPVGLWTPCYTDVVCVLAAQPGGPLPEPMLGALAPAHASAPGKVLLAHRDRWRDSVLSRRLERHTPRTVTDPDDLRAQLDRILTHGHATDTGEHHDDVHAVAVAVVVDDEAIAALSIQPAASDHDDAELPSLIAQLHRVANAIAGTPDNHQQGSRPPTRDGA